MWKRILPDLGFWYLIGLNAYVFIYFLQHPDFIDTIIALFWLQSVCIGLFNALNMFTLTNIVPDSFNWNDGGSVKPGCSGIFFLLHFGFFHVMYIFFLIPQVINPLKFDWAFLKISFLFILAGSAIEFVKDKIRNREEAVNVGAMFFLPYIRIVPMHLIILTPAFFHIAKPIFFLLLKAVSDIVMYFIYKKAIFKPVN